MGIVEALLIFAVAAFHLAVMPWGIWSDELVTNTFSDECRFKQRWNIALAVGKAVCKLKAVVCLNTLDFDPSPLIPNDSSYSKIGRRIDALVRLCVLEPQSG